MGRRIAGLQFERALEVIGRLAEPLRSSGYGQYLLQLLRDGA